MKFFACLILALTLAYSAFSQMYTEVTAPYTFLRKTPGPGGEKLQNLQRGDRLKLENLTEKDGWLFVSTLDGKTKGWVSVNAVSKIEVQTVTTPTVTPTPTPITRSAPTPRLDPPVVPTPGESPTPKPKPTSIAKPSPTPVATLTPSRTSDAKAEPTPEATPTPIETPTPEAIPIPIETPTPEATPIPIETPTPEATPIPIETPTPEPTPTPTATPTPEPTPIIDNEVLRVDTEEVSLNVRVVDEQNRFVGNLAQDDFKIYEDGVLQEITSITTTEVPTINGLVIDNSRSLRSQLGKVIEAGKIIVGTNRRDDESTVIRFVSKDKIEVVQDFTKNISSLSNALDNLYVEGGQTAIIDAIYMAAKKIDRYQFSLKKQDVKLRSLILVSDGDDRNSTYSEQALFDLLRQTSVQIYAIGFVSDFGNETLPTGQSRQEKARSFLTRLAEETGGKVYFPASIDELPKIANEISGELRTQYTISYMPTNEVRDGSFRPIKVEVSKGANQEKRIAITRAGRTVVPN